MVLIRSLISWVEGLLDLLESIRDTIPGFLRGIAGWIIGKIDAAIDKVMDLLEFLADVSFWTGLVHELAFHILRLDEIWEGLARLFDIPLWTWENIITKVFNGIRYIVGMSVQHGDAFVAALKDALLRAFDALNWTFDTVKLLAISAINELLESTDWLWEQFLEHVWPRIIGAGGKLEDWVLESADWLWDTVLIAPFRLWDWLTDLTELPFNILNMIGFDWLKRVKDGPKAFFLFLIEQIGDILEDIAEPIVDLGETIFDFVWGDE